MRRLLSVGSLLALYELCRWDLEMAGPPYVGPLDREDEPKTVADLQREFQGRVSEGICQVFGRGVEHHLRGHIQEARREYNILRRIPLASGGAFDLASVSETFQHNLRLLDRDYDET
jgi:hypothetical protein